MGLFYKKKIFVALDYCFGGVFIGRALSPRMLIMNDSCSLSTSKLLTLLKKNLSGVNN